MRVCCNLHALVKLTTDSSFVLLPSELMAVQDIVDWLRAGPLITPETKFSSYVYTKLTEDGRVSFPSIVQSREALGDATALQTHFS